MSVYKYKNANGKTLWYFTVRLYGKQHVHRGFSTKKEAELEEIAFSRDYVPPQKNQVTWLMLLKSYSDYYQQTVKNSSFYAFKLRCEKYLKLMPNYEITDIDFPTLDQFMKTIPAPSRKVKQVVLNDLKRIFDYCDVFYGIHNVQYKRLVIPKDYSIRSIKEKYVLSISDFKKLYKGCDGDSYWETLFLTSFICGLRISETRGIQPKCFDFQKGTLLINQQAAFKYNGDKGLVTSPKTQTSNRTYILPEFLLTKVQEYIKTRHLGPNCFLFHAANSHARPVGQITVYRKLHKIQKNVNLPFFKFHALRRSEASLLNDKGLSGTIISDYLGHNSFETTKQYYLGDNQEKKEKVRDILSGIVTKIVA